MPVTELQLAITLMEDLRVRASLDILEMEQFVQVNTREIQQTVLHAALSFVKNPSPFCQVHSFFDPIKDLHHKMTKIITLERFA